MLLFYNSSPSDYSGQRHFLSSANTVVSPATHSADSRRPITFQPVVLEQETGAIPFFQSTGSDNNHKRQQQHTLGHLDGIVSTPTSRNSKWRSSDSNSKRFAAILLETNVIELQRHLLTLSVQNQVSF